VDFFVPVIDEEGKSVPLPTNMFNKFGYAIEFNSSGKFKNYTIDFEALADHLLALKEAADKHKVKIKWVIFDNELQKLLFKTSKGPQLREKLIFSKKTPWVRHDEHYHVDFIVPGKKLR
jgi:penicillin-insensitive murein endopeptidase